MRSHVRKTLVAIGLLTAGGFALTTQGAADSKTTPKETIITADTAPSETPKLSFNFPGIVKEVLVKEGDVIKRGQPLMVQDDDIEQAELDRLKAEADSEARIDYYKADRDYKQATRDRKVNAAEGAFSDAEKDEAKADYVKAERQIDVANLDHNGDKIKGRQQALKVEKMTLKSTIDGIVQKIGVHAGELAEMDKDKPAINLVKNDPCYVEIKELTSAQVARV
ncbi:MAG TPA: biotin/lipoyl-binding protein, partial [Tepidisphaeraceae bacterium]